MIFPFQQFIYADQLIDKVSDAIEVLYLADKYDVQVLVDNCREVMTRGIDTSEAIKMYETASKFNLFQLQEEARFFINR